MRTTNLEAIKTGADFTWGKVIKIHEINEYSVIEAIDNMDGKNWFYPYVNNEVCNASSAYLETAFMIAFAHKHTKKDTTAAYYAAQLVGIKEE